jgi:hypothetical protein
VLEVHDGGPVVRLVLLELAGRASSGLGEVGVGVHGDVESITTNDLVDVGGHTAGVDQAICIV